MPTEDLISLFKDLFLDFFTFFCDFATFGLFPKCIVGPSAEPGEAAVFDTKRPRRFGDEDTGDESRDEDDFEGDDDDETEEEGVEFCCTFSPPAFRLILRLTSEILLSFGLTLDNDDNDPCKVSFNSMISSIEYSSLSPLSNTTVNFLVNASHFSTRACSLFLASK
jgi:hypothetical protein